MSMRALEGAIRSEAARVFCNSRLRVKDLREWSTDTIKPHEGEHVAYVGQMDLFADVA